MTIRGCRSELTNNHPKKSKETTKSNKNQKNTGTKDDVEAAWDVPPASTASRP